MLVFVCFLGAAGGCSDDPTGNSVGYGVLYPIHHDRPSWSAQNTIAYYDYGVVCVNEELGGGRIDPARVGICVIDVATRETRLLVPGGNQPAWSADGQTLAYTAGGQVFTVGQGGGSPRQITAQAQCSAPAWSPDGQWIAFESTAGSPQGRYGIWKILVEAGTSQKLGGTTEEWRDPSWSPDGGTILHVRHLPTVGSELFRMDASGGHELRLTNNTKSDTDPTYSPDGNRLVFIEQDLESAAGPRMVLANVDGSGVELLSNTPAAYPSWSPNGSQIVFCRWERRSNDPANGTLWIIDLDSRVETQLTFGLRVGRET